MSKNNRVRKLIDLPLDTVEIINQLAQKDGRSTKNLLEYIISEHVAAAKGDKEKVTYNRL